MHCSVAEKQWNKNSTCSSMNYKQGNWKEFYSSINRYTPTPQLELSGPADFGVTVADGKVLSQEIYVINEGSLTGEFKIRYNGDQPITIMPTGGVVRPGTKQVVKVRLCVNK